MPADALHDDGNLDDFRLSSVHDVAAMLRRLIDDAVVLNLNAADGSAVRATLWSCDQAGGSITLNVGATDPALPALLDSQEAVVVGHLDNIKLQFDLTELVLVNAAQASVLRCSWPREMFRFQRRTSFRVRPPLRHSPIVRLRHTDIAEMQLALRVLDLSVGGCALLLPPDVPPMQVGGVVNQVQIELDADTHFQVNLRLQHVTSLRGDGQGVRLGCEFVHADAAALRALQRFIDLTQKRSKLYAAH